jgi:hypothetical protein
MMTICTSHDPYFNVPTNVNDQVRNKSRKVKVGGTLQDRFQSRISLFNLS